jgi:hypothetical protein
MKWIQLLQLHAGGVRFWKPSRNESQQIIFLWVFLGESGTSTCEKEMITALAARKEALELKLKEKTEELRQICFREAVSQSVSFVYHTILYLWSNL